MIININVSNGEFTDLAREAKLAYLCSFAIDLRARGVELQGLTFDLHKTPIPENAVEYPWSARIDGHTFCFDQRETDFLLRFAKSMKKNVKVGWIGGTIQNKAVV